MEEGLGLRIWSIRVGMRSGTSIKKVISLIKHQLYARRLPYVITLWDRLPFFFTHFFTCAYIVWAISPPYPLLPLCPLMGYLLEMRKFLQSPGASQQQTLDPNLTAKHLFFLPGQGAFQIVHCFILENRNL
jgi:hypothetical protein